ncbi:Dolichyl-diphosphooligosaccharide-protein glycosyltransferase subunit OST5 [Forsythia ovata]|uniref:Dolichyl-diphosphooligosaccharide-protein glycosyltransferase subunit OST5 n=1 Tax=Forsythia ovata TaxID=205694 RepID=A0ABD1SKS8_9LAMI
MAKSISSPVPDAWYPTLAVFMLCIGLVVTASFFIYEATSSSKNRRLTKELTTGAVASVFLFVKKLSEETKVGLGLDDVTLLLCTDGIDDLEWGTVGIKNMTRSAQKKRSYMTPTTRRPDIKVQQLVKYILVLEILYLRKFHENPRCS